MVWEGCGLEIHNWLVRSANPSVGETLRAEKQGRKNYTKHREGANDVKLASKPHSWARIEETKRIYKETAGSADHLGSAPTE